MSDSSSTSTQNTKPRCGGISENLPWCGGSQHDKGNVMPMSTNCFRPATLKEMKQIEESCKKGLSESYQLPLEVTEKSKVTMTSWIPNLKADIEECGLDGVFRVQFDSTGTMAVS